MDVSIWCCVKQWTSSLVMNLLSRFILFVSVNYTFCLHFVNMFLLLTRVYLQSQIIYHKSFFISRNNHTAAHHGWYIWSCSRPIGRSRHNVFLTIIAKHHRQTRSYLYTWRNSRPHKTSGCSDCNKNDAQIYVHSSIFDTHTTPMDRYKLKIIQ